MDEVKEKKPSEEKYVEEKFIEEGEENKNTSSNKYRKIRTIGILFGSLILLYGTVLFVGYFIQNWFVFDPKPKFKLKSPSIKDFGNFQQNYSNVSSNGWTNVVLGTKDGVKLHNFFIFAKKRISENRKVPPTILFIHGKDGCIDKRWTMMKQLYDKRNGFCNIFMLSYRGYGLSTGSPSELGFKTDAQTALIWLIENLSEEERQKIFVYGQSMGGAVAINLVSNNNEHVRGLIVENTFLSITKLMPDLSVLLYPFIPIMNQIFDNESHIKNITKPILFLSGKKDTFIPPKHMEKLHEIAKGKGTITKCEFISFPEGNHLNTSYQLGYFEKISNFMDNCLTEKEIKEEK